MTELRELLDKVKADWQRGDYPNGTNWYEESGKFDQQRMEEVIYGLDDFELLETLGEEIEKQYYWRWNNPDPQYFVVTKLYLGLDGEKYSIDKWWKHMLREKRLQMSQRNRDKFLRGEESTAHGSSQDTKEDSCEIPREMKEKISTLGIDEENVLPMIFAKLRKAGLLNKDCMPNKNCSPKVSWSHAAYMAKEIERAMGVSFRWKIWQELWNRPNIRDDYSQWNNRLKDDVAKEIFVKKVTKVLE